MKNVREYHDLHLKNDVWLFVDVLNEFRNIRIECYILGPCHYFVSPGLSWNVMLKMADIEL